MARRSKTGPETVVGEWAYIHDLEPTHVSSSRAGGIRSLVGGNPASAKRARYNFEVRRYAAIESSIIREDGERHQVSFNAVRTDPYFRHWRRILASHEERVARGESVNRAPDGLYAEALERLHYRRPQSPWNVGETPRVKERAG